MKLSEFIVFNEAEKKHAVMNNAVALATRTLPGLVVFLLAGLRAAFFTTFFAFFFAMLI